MTVGKGVAVGKGVCVGNGLKVSDLPFDMPLLLLLLFPPLPLPPFPLPPFPISRRPDEARSADLSVASTAVRRLWARMFLTVRKMGSSTLICSVFFSFNTILSKFSIVRGGSAAPDLCDVCHCSARKPQRNRRRAAFRATETTEIRRGARS